MSITGHIRGLRGWRKLVKNWGEIIKLKLGILRGEIYLKFRNGLVLRLMNRGIDSDTVVVREIYLEKVYSLGDFDKLNEGAVVLDIGANVGIYSTFIANKNKNCKVYSYEASNENYNYLLWNIKKNSFSNIKAFNLAVTSKNKGTVKFYIHERGSGGCSLFKDFVISKDKIPIEVKQTNLQTILKENNLKKIDLLKMDIEGGEYDVIQNASKEVLSKISKIVMETHPLKNCSEQELIGHLRNNGFKIWKPEPHTIYASKK